MKSDQRLRSLAAYPLIVATFLLVAQSGAADPEPAIGDVSWLHGSVDCSKNVDPAIQVFRQDEHSYVLRQNKCLSYEAPFIYVLLGDERALLLDTGATEDAESFPIYDTVKSLVGNRDLLVLHSHSHRDHYAGDAQFSGKPGVELVAPSSDGLAFFLSGIESEGSSYIIELGNRELTLLRIPGHQEESIALYDARTRWLLTGDTVYPGLIYVKHWDAYQNSISALAAFSENHQVNAVLGAHVEMTASAKQLYPIGTVYQPDEAALPLDPALLIQLNGALQSTSSAETVQLGEMTVKPMNLAQKTLSKIARFFVN
jgi:hydroxyacylglutathione hydrolase